MAALGPGEARSIAAALAPKVARLLTAAGGGSGPAPGPTAAGTPLVAGAPPAPGAPPASPPGPAPSPVLSEPSRERGRVEGPVPWKAALVAGAAKPEVWTAVADALERDRVEALLVLDPAGPTAREEGARDALAEPPAPSPDLAYVLTRDFKFLFVVRRGAGPVLAGPERFLARVEAALGDLVRRIRP